jgi:hypothetical protein
MSPAVSHDRRGAEAARAARVAHARRTAWLLGALALAFYVGFYVWSLIRDSVTAAGA